MVHMEMPLCACGCGQRVNVPSTRHKTRIPRYLKGHHSRSNEWKRKIPPDVPIGICECGCGQKTEICTYARQNRREYTGHPLPLIRGHRRAEPSDTIRKLSEKESAYLAGIIDGEGSIKICGKNNRSVRVTVANTDLQLIDWLREIGGTIILNKRPTETAKQAYIWNVSSWRTCHSILIQTIPFMIIKRNLASGALQLLTQWLSGPKHEKKRYCKHGHTFISENTSIDQDGAQRCKQCVRESTRKSRAKNISLINNRLQKLKRKLAELQN